MKIHKHIKLNAAVLLVAGTVGIATANPAQAALCSTLPTLNALGLGNTCTTLGGWSFTLNSFMGFDGGDQISFSGGGIATTPLTYSIQSQTTPWLVTGSPFKLGYSVTAPAPRLLNTFTNSLTSSATAVPGGDAGTWAVTGTPGVASASFSTPMGMNGSQTYATSLSSDTFSATLNITNGEIQSVTSTISSKDSTSTVPGPLPLLGAGAAFGFSRRLRNRVKLAA